MLAFVRGQFLRNPIFWIAFTLIAVLCGWFSKSFADRAFPVISLDIEMDREEALDEARKLASDRGWGPARFDQAVSFELDTETQEFVELGAGGSDEFRRLLESGDYEAYTWTVRHFREGDPRETWVYFAPDGIPNGFEEILSEEEAGASLVEEEARAIAEDTAAREWSFDLSRYELVDSSEEKLDSGRVDHTFTYELKDRKIGEGRIQLDLVVSGDRLTAFIPFVRVPETFERHYERLRSFNDGIAFGAAVSTGLLYFIGGCGIGLLFLLRKRWLIWRKPVLWGAVIALAVGAAQLSQLPLAWMDYDTATSKGSFLFSQIATAGALTLGTWALLAVSFMAAEGLTRKAFPRHLQMWKLWSKDAASTEQLLGRTLGGYLYIAVELAFIVGFYLFTTRFFDWYSPSSSSVEPNVLGQWIPWLGPVAFSAQAGMWEECLFRAIPLAGAALIGERLGRRKTFIGVAFVLQAVIFAAAHANYPGEPPYSRLVELIIPSLVFGALYLWFGLLPGIVLHFGFDLVLFSLPLFTANADRLVVDRALVILLGLLPLGVVLYSRLRTGIWREAGPELLNEDWRPAERIEQTQPERHISHEVRIFPRWLAAVVIFVGVVGLISWGTGGFETDAPSLEVNRKEATSRAFKALRSDGVNLDGFDARTTVHGTVTPEHEFVWQDSGVDDYDRLLGSFLEPPLWGVRFVRTKATIEESAEEYEVFLGPEGAVFNRVHVIPEKRKGAQLDEGAARSIALQAMSESFGEEARDAIEISSSPVQLDNRKDWTFEFKAQNVKLAKGGQARFVIEIAGDEVVDSYRYVFVPEKVERQRQEEESFATNAALVGGVILALGGLALAVLSIVKWSKKNFDRRLFFVIVPLVAVLQMISGINSWPAIESAFSTAQPFTLQAVIAVVGLWVAALFLASGLGLLAGMAFGWRPPQGEMSNTRAWLIGGSLGAAAQSLVLVSGATPIEETLPYWPDFSGAATWIPFLSQVGGGILFAGSALASLAMFVTVERVTAVWSTRRWITLGMFVLLGLGIAGVGDVRSLTEWGVGGLIAALGIFVAYAVILRSNLVLIIPASAVGAALAILSQGLAKPYPGALAAAVIGAVLILSVAFWLTRRWLS